MNAAVEFFYMGGHYGYVWFSWGLTAFVLGWCVWQPIRRHRRLLLEVSAAADRASARDSQDGGASRQRVTAVDASAEVADPGTSTESASTEAALAERTSKPVYGAQDK